MFYYLALSFFFSLIMLFLSLVHDRMFLYEIGYFKLKELSKRESFFLFYQSRFRKMSNIAYYFQVAAYLFFLASIFFNTVLGILQLSEDPVVVAGYNTFFTYAFYLVTTYFLGNILVYKIKTRMH